jgi:SAM-dependent methyltransferase
MNTAQQQTSMREHSCPTLQNADGALVRERLCPACLGENIHPKNSFLWECECGFVFDNPRPTPEAIVAYYNQNDKYEHWLQDLEGRDEMWNRRLKKMLSLHKRGSLLDVGSGIGQFLSVAKKYGFAPVYGTELSSIGAGIAKERYDIELLRGDIHSLDLPVVDNLTVFHVLEHVHQPLEFLQRCHQLLAPGGVITVAVPNDVESLMYRLKYHRLSRIDFDEKEIHLSHFNPRTLQSLVVRAGFRVVNISLDPFWPRKDWRQTARFQILSAVNTLTGLNLYPTIWLTAVSGRGR